MSITRRIVRLIGVILLALAVVMTLAVAAIFAISESRINRIFDVSPTTLAIPMDAASVTEGERLAIIRGCAGCHGQGLGGRPLFNMTGFAYMQLSSQNLTRGSGGIGAQLNDGDWERAIRHGIGRDGRALWLMPSDTYWNLSDADTAAIITYLKQLPPMDNAQPQKSIGLLFRGLTVTNQFPLLSAERINHTAARPAAPPAAPTIEFGAYVAQVCTACHGIGFSGGPLDGRPEAPRAANLTPSGELTGWKEEWFTTALRTGVLPSGRTMDPEYMPWKSTALMTNTEIQAVWRYLKSLPPRPSGTK